MEATLPAELALRWRRAAPLAALGSLGVVAGGLASAATAFAPSYHASWAVAYVVLVAGAAQFALGLGQALLAPRPPSAVVVAGEAAAFNLGNAGVLAGNLSGAQALTYAGSALLVACLALMFAAVRGPARGGWPLLAYRTVLAMLLVSIPVGLLIAQATPS